MSLKALNEATFDDEIYRIDGIELHVVRIMGNVDSVDEHSTNMSYKVNDGTGVIECKQWMEKDQGRPNHRRL